jgi:hypothetical protein
MDEATEQEEGGYVSPYFVKKCTRLKWNCLTQGVSLEALECPFPKLYIYKKVKEDLEMHEIHVIFLRKWKVYMKIYGLQNPICSLFFDQYESLTPTEQHTFEKRIEAEQPWSNLSFDVCRICQGCHLTTMQKTLVEFGHTNERQRKPICGSCANNPKQNTIQNRVIPYWMYRHGSCHTTVPEQLSGLTFAEKHLIEVASSHMSLIHLKDGTLGSRGGIGWQFNNRLQIFFSTTKASKRPNFFSLRQSGRSSDQEVYEKIFKVRRKKAVVALNWLVEHNVLYQEFKVVTNPSNLDWMGDDEECTLPITCTIETQYDDTPEDDDMGPSLDQTLMDQLDKIEGVDFEVSVT